jgi:hypothetical protein
MRAYVLILLCAWVAPSVLSAQQPGARHVLVDDVPEGTNWIANARTHVYYPVGCPITASIPEPDKLFYKVEESLQKAGFTKSDECDLGAPATRSPTATPAVPVPMPSSAAGTSTPDQPTEKPAEPKNRRMAFWFNAGFGYGSLGCQDCNGRTGSLTGGIALGGSVSQKVLLGVATTGWAKSENGAELDVGTLVAVIRFYPSATGAFFLLGGLGVGSIHGESSFVGSQTETGFGALLGLGYDIRVGRNVSLTPFWNGFAVNASNDDANVGQLGLGLTIH